ncbi:hypothetical protein POL68_36255 [Stigmatella sp. ncwal1]|uniref:Uncharacterized protein n=1 Tax=Stigmatella ashevillensis TaxID=2995309 RepID=A0ABT5DKB7_9BACT|nr:hypothetical protein [Stigmatella ashevillena]MDC0713976.1 hypothetical protein [Stigmatella ashevillena]
MKRELLLTLLAAGTATSALAKEPPRVVATPQATTPHQATVPTQVAVPKAILATPVAEPTYFDVVGSDDKGTRVATYRYFRRTREISVLKPSRQIEDVAAFSKFSSPGDYVIAVAPEKKPKPNPPNPGEEFRTSWTVPRAELQEAMAKIQSKVPAAKNFLVGQFVEDAPLAK